MLIKEPYHHYQHQVKMYNIAMVIPAFAEMESGTTLTAIAVAGYRFTQKTNPFKRLLIVAPASTCSFVDSTGETVASFEFYDGLLVKQDGIWRCHSKFKCRNAPRPI